MVGEKPETTIGEAHIQSAEANTRETQTGEAQEKSHDEIAENNTAYVSLQKQYQELLAAAKQVAADFDNFRKRTEAEQQKETKLATKTAVLKLLPILDHFAISLEHAPQQGSQQDEFTKAMELIYSQLIDMLEDQGVTPIPALHCTFDPRVHEAVLFAPSTNGDNVIVEELQRGYFMHDTIIRTSKVKVARKEEHT